MKSRVDILSIGDVVTDAFIKLDPEYVSLDDRKQHDLRLSIPYGAKIPFEEVVIIPGVGNAANAAVSFARLGLRSALLAHVGHDPYGQEILHALAHNKIQTQFVHSDAGKFTNYHYVLWYKQDRTILVKHEKYNWHLPELTDIDRPAWIYLSRLGPDTLAFHHQIATFMSKNTDIKLVFQPDRFQMEFGVEKIAGIYKHSELVFCNREEAMLITSSRTDEIVELMRRMHKLGPKQIVITDGPKGSYGSDGTTIWSMRNYPDPAAPVDRTGAGDAFASTVTAAIAAGKSLDEALLWAPINSMSVVQEVGAQEGLLTRAKIESWLKKAPHDYKPKTVGQI